MRGARPLPLIVSSLLALSTLAQAQIFTYTNNDLILGLRKNSPYTDNNEVVVDIGQASSYFNLAVGTTISVPGFSPSQLAGSFTGSTNVSWSVVGGYSGSGYSGYVNNTLWVTVPRQNNAIQSLAPVRLWYGSQQVIKAKMNSIVSPTGGAVYISQALGASSQFNTVSFVREPRGTYLSQILSVWMAGLANPTWGTLNDTWPPSEPNNANLEVTTPGNLSGVVRSDLYEVRPLTTASGSSVTDPHTGTSGIAWYIGYFEFNAAGTMTFTRAAASTSPSQVALQIARTNNVSTISFVSSNSVTYKLCFTNSAGVTAPVSNWPSLPGTISGDGTTKSFQDTTTDPSRFYRVQEQ
jgi:hypothetical protein